MEPAAGGVERGLHSRKFDAHTRSSVASEGYTARLVGGDAGTLGRARRDWAIGRQWLVVS